MNIARMKLLRDLLLEMRNASDRGASFLDMRSWVDNEARQPTNIKNQTFECGTIACIAGWASLTKEFNKEGLQFKNHSITYKIYTGYHALSHFFEIKLQTALTLFDPNRYKIGNQTKVINEATDRVITLLGQSEKINKVKAVGTGNKKRITKAYRILSDLPTETQQNVSMHHWYKEETSRTEEPHNCKTTACAIGWLTQNEEIKSEGLTLSENGACGIPRYGNLCNYEAVAAFFNIDYEVALTLFHPNFYKNKKGKKALHEVLTNFISVFDF